MCAVPDALERKSIMFENGQTAEILQFRQPLNADEVLQALDIQPAEAAIIVGGSTTPFQPRLKNRLLDLLSRGVAQAAKDSGAILLDQGAKAGVSKLIGQGVADRGRKTQLVGVISPEKTGSPEGPAPDGNKNLDPNHTHFVINEHERQGWRAEMICNLAEAATSNREWIMTILVGGETESVAMNLALETVRRGWFLVVIEGSGPLADQIVKLTKQKLSAEKRTGRIWERISPFSSSEPLAMLRETNPRLYEILSDGKIMILGEEFDATQLRNLIKGTFTPLPVDGILWTAWGRFAEYDLNSLLLRSQWRRLKNLPLAVGVYSTLIYLVYSAPSTPVSVDILENPLWVQAYSAFMNSLSGIHSDPTLDLIFQFTIILLPIASAILVDIESNTKQLSQYTLLRNAAEGVKRGIYSFRALANLDRSMVIDSPLPSTERGLAEHLSKINKSLAGSVVNEIALIPYAGPLPPNMYGAEAYDDGFSYLNPETYVKIRIGDQLKFYTLRTNQYDRRIRNLRYMILVSGGIGTFLAAIGAQYWLPFTAAIVSAATAFLKSQQLEEILTKYNQTKINLENARSEWQGLPEAERYRYYPRLVQNVEAILETEGQSLEHVINRLQENEMGRSAPEMEPYVTLVEETEQGERGTESG